MSPAWLPPLLLAIPGALAARRALPGGGRAESFGLGILLGLSVGMNGLFLAHLCGLPLTAPAALGGLGALTLAATALLRRRGPGPTPTAPPATPWTPAELLLAAAVALLVLLSAAKGGFYPIVATDAHAYDGRARWIVAERTLDLSIYRELGATGATNLSYPPLFPLSLALGYWVGAEQGRVVDSWYFAAAAFALYGFLRRRLPRAGALLGALLLVATPEVWNHASLALINLPAMAFMAAALLTALWLVEAAPEPRRPAWPGWLVAGLLAAGAAGVRSDAVLVVATTAGGLGALLLRRRVRWPLVLARTGLYAGPALFITLVWQLYLKGHFGVTNSEPFRPGLIADGPTLGYVVRMFFEIVTFPNLYGVTAWALLCATLLTLVARPRPVAPFLNHLAMTATLAVTLIALYQALDPAFGGGLREILPTSFKRGVFYLIPLMIASTLLAPLLRREFERFDAWQRSS